MLLSQMRCGVHFSAICTVPCCKCCNSELIPLMDLTSKEKCAHAHLCSCIEKQSCMHMQGHIMVSIGRYSSASAL
jgi:hypothetical protein